MCYETNARLTFHEALTNRLESTGMRRRTLLVAGVVGLAGCLSNGSNGSPATDTPTSTPAPIPSKTDTPGGSPDRRYEECPREIIRYEEFPDDVRDEIDAALDGRYEADRIYLRETMDVERSYVSVDGTYYDPTVEQEGGDRETLTLRAVEPKALPRTRSVSVENGRDGERTITVDAVAEDGTELFFESRTVHPGGDVEFGRIARVGTHELRITVADDEDVETETTETARIDESHFDVIVVVEPDEVYVTGAVAELVGCRFEE